MRIELQHVRYMPKNLSPGVLYVSLEFETAAHLCACACGSKVRTPLSPTDWALEETDSGPTLYPSIGNWQQSCKSHYWIQGGRIIWAEKWTADEIAAGRRAQEQRDRAYYEARGRVQEGALERFWRWARSLLKNK